MSVAITVIEKGPTQVEKELLPLETAEAALACDITESEFQRTQHQSTLATGDAQLATKESSHKEKRPRFDQRSAFVKDEDDSAELRALWAPSTAEEHPSWKQVDAFEKTVTMVHGQVESIICQGLEAYHARERLSRELDRAKQEIENKDRDLKRLRSFEEQSRTTVSNLLRALETAKTDARDASRAVQMEARLRAELSFMRSERDASLSAASESNRKVQLLEDDLRSTKSKLAKTSQEKAKTERDSRAAIQLARSLDTNSSNEDYYKHKVTDLTNQLEANKAMLIEQQRQMDDMRRQTERSMSQSRLAKIRAEGTKKFNP